MDYRNSSQKWGAISQIFHWGMFAILIGLYSVAYIMQDMAPGDQKWALYGMHKQIGVTMILLIAARVWWRRSNTVPKDLNTVPQWQNMAARGNVYILYVLLFVFPLSGLFMSILGGHDVNYFGLFTIPSITEGKTVASGLLYKTHIYTSYTLLGFAGLHIAAGLYHHFVLRDTILRRMLPGA